MSLWVDKYKPTSIDQLTYHKGLSKQLKGLARSDNLPHLLFYGPSGGGKKTRIAAMLRELFGPGVEKLKIDQRQFSTPSNRKLIFTIVQSNYHLEINPSDLGFYDRIIVQDVIKSIAQTQQVDANAKHQYKVVVIDQADELTREAQAALRRTMEKYTTNLRLILCCNSLSKLIAPLRSRCLILRVPRPTLPEVSTGLQLVANQEKFNLPKPLAENIGRLTQCNMRSSLLTLESTAVKFADLSNVQVPDAMDWEVVIQGLAKMILEEQTPQRLLETRKHVYDLITRGVEPTVIMKNLSFQLMKRMDSEMQRTVIDKAAYHQHRMNLGRKHVFHLEAFIASVMDAYLRHRTKY
ncbi:putative subunit of DNA replication factor C (RF-C) [Lichtheimia hyalospora FSU 10163]|nr:putative subunit of DNA replication factor C (RF-C) [Lichtheimia hyalospora FSU 10163]